VDQFDDNIIGKNPRSFEVLAEAQLPTTVSGEGWALELIEIFHTESWGVGNFKKKQIHTNP